MGGMNNQGFGQGVQGFGNYNVSQQLRDKLGFWPAPDCTSCVGSGYSGGKGNVVCLICPTKNYLPQQQGLSGSNIGYSQGGFSGSNINQNIGGSNIGYSQSGYNVSPQLRDKLGFWPVPDCTSCVGSGYLGGKGTQFCTICPTKNYIPQQQGFGGFQQNIGYDHSLKEKLGFYPNPQCTYCRGGGLSIGTSNVCSVCKIANWTPLNLHQTQGSSGISQGTNYVYTFTEQQPYMGIQGYHQGLREKIGFWPDPACLACKGSGYQLGRNNELCIICPGMQYQPTMGSNISNLGSNIGSNIQGNQYGQNVTTPSISRDNLGFTPNSHCTKCQGTGMKIGRKGKEKVCKKCKTSWDKNKGHDLGTGMTGKGIQNDKLNFTPVSNCHLCKGSGFLKDKPGEVCRLCASHVPLSNFENQGNQGGLTGTKHGVL